MKFITKITLFSLLLGSACLQASNEKNPETLLKKTSLIPAKYPLLKAIALHYDKPIKYLTDTLSSAIDQVAEYTNFFDEAESRKFAKIKEVMNELNAIKNDPDYPLTSQEEKLIDATNDKFQIIALFVKDQNTIFKDQNTFEDQKMIEILKMIKTLEAAKQKATTTEEKKDK